MNMSSKALHVSEHSFERIQKEGKFGEKADKVIKRILDELDMLRDMKNR